jgi:hypothetical protein
MATETNDIAEALKQIPVSWLHQPRLVARAKADTPAPKIGPLAAAAIGVAVGGGLQLAGQAIRKTGPDEQDRLVQAVECNLSIEEIEQISRSVMKDAQGSKGGLNTLVDTPPPGAKPFPLATAAFLAGVAAGAAAARP